VQLGGEHQLEHFGAALLDLLEVDEFFDAIVFQEVVVPVVEVLFYVAAVFSIFMEADDIVLDALE